MQTTILPREKAAQVGAFIWNRYVIRDDVYATYRLDGSPVCVKDLDHPGDPIVTPALLMLHVTGQKTLGMYSTNLQDECLWVTIDIDAHDDKADPAANFRYAEHLYQKLKGMGFDPLLTDSNGRGGFHLTCFFTQPTPAADVYGFGHWLVSDHESYGVPLPEVFPKQIGIKGRYGNQVRVPGKHHKRDHWSRVWDGSNWLEWHQAVDHLTSRKPTNPDGLPKAATSFRPPVKQHAPLVPGDWDSYKSGTSWPANYDGDLETLRIRELVADRIINHKGEVAEITCPWASEHSSGPSGTAVWDARPGLRPAFRCLHHHCDHRRLEDLLAFYGKAKVDACCDKLFGSPQKLAHEAFMSAAEDVLDEVVRPVDPAALARLPTVLPDPVADKPVRTRPAMKLKELWKRPDPTWLVKDHLHQNTVAVVYGPPGICKSFWALHMAMCVATGMDFFGRRVKKGPVAYVYSEGETDVKLRTEAWCQHFGVYPEDLAIFPFAFNLKDPTEAATILDTAREELGADPVLIVIDTFSRNMGGADENSPVDMPLFVNGLDALKARGATVFGVAHPGKDSERGLRGHSSLMGALDTVFKATASDGRKKMLIECEKMKTASEIEGYCVAKSLVRIQRDGEPAFDEDGEPLTSLVLETEDGAITRVRLLTQAKKEFLCLLNDKFKNSTFRNTDVEKVATGSKSTISENVKYLKHKRLLVATDKGYHIPSEVTGALLVD